MSSLSLDHAQNHHKGFIKMCDLKKYSKRLKKGYTQDSKSHSILCFDPQFK